VKLRLPAIIAWMSVLAFASADRAMAAARLSGIFKSEMLNVELPYLESITGPAMHIYPGRADTQAREYRIEGCKVQAFIKGTRVRRYSLSLAPKCNFNLGALLYGYSSTSGLTVGKFASGAQHPIMRFQADCMDLCGNAADPTVDFKWEGPHSANFIAVVLTVVLADRAAVDASLRLQSLMQKNEGEDYVRNTRFNCDGKYDDVAVRSFASVAVNEITVGYPDIDERCPQ
jgi:hypothetical protein